MTSMLRSFFLMLRTLARSRAALHLEILALRHQLDVLQRTRPPRVRLAKTDRWLSLLKSPFLLQQLMLRPTMDTLLSDDVCAPVHRPDAPAKS